MNSEWISKPLNERIIVKDYDVVFDSVIFLILDLLNNYQLLREILPKPKGKKKEAPDYY